MPIYIKQGNKITRLKDEQTAPVDVWWSISDADALVDELNRLSQLLEVREDEIVLLNEELGKLV